MKVLFIGSQKSDYLQDLTYNGLSRVLGKKNIIELPLNLKYHLPLKNYPKNQGYTKLSLLSVFMRSYNFNNLDLVIIGSAKPDTFESYLNIIDKISAKTPIIFIDGGDYSSIGGDLERLTRKELYTKAINIREFDYVFKREYLLEDEWPQNIFPFPFSFDVERFGKKNICELKKYAVSFWAVESDEIRTKALKMLEGKYDCFTNGTTTNQVFRKYKRKGLKYLEELSACKIVLNFRGVGWDTMRYWETPALSTFLLSQKPKIRIPHEFENEKHMVYLNDDLVDLHEKIGYYLKHDSKREAIAKQGFQHLVQFHSTIVRAKYLLRKSGY